MSDVYRQAASILILRPAEVCVPGGECKTIHQILLLRKPRTRDTWQLPQGGMEEGETVTQAALRELKEEASLTGCRVLGISTRVYQYEFPASFRRLRPDNVRGQRIAFVFALAATDAAIVVDGKEVDGFAWVDAGELPRYIKRKEYLALVKSVYAEAMSGLGALLR